MATRNRVIYQSEALYVSPDATGFHYTGNAGIGVNHPHEVPLGATMGGQRRASVLNQFSRVQSANYSFTINRQDVNQFGQLGRIDSIILESPTVALDFTYYLTDGENERLLGFNVDGVSSCVSGRLLADKSEGQNFFILTTKEGEDAIGNKLNDSDSDQGVIALGNGFLSDYSVDMSVGALPTASVSIEGFNISSDVGTTGNVNPAIDPLDGTYLKNFNGRQYTVPVAIKNNASGEAGIQESALRPGDIALDLEDSALISSQVGNTDGKTSAHIQSCSISVPLSRSVLERLGSNFGYTRVVDFPINATMTISALVADLKSGNLIERIYEEEEDQTSARYGLAKAHDLTVTLRKPVAKAYLPGQTSDIGMKFTMKNAVLESESFSSAIGDNKSVDLTFTTQISGPQDLDNGMFIFGEVSKNAEHGGKPPTWGGNANQYLQNTTSNARGQAIKSWDVGY
tara:strand:- start:114 stop:1484 length:1371 start_codon:yes stop_codon:yes gene_type:complete